MYKIYKRNIYKKKQFLNKIVIQLIKIKYYIIYFKMPQQIDLLFRFKCEPFSLSFLSRNHFSKL